MILKKIETSIENLKNLYKAKETHIAIENSIKKITDAIRTGNKLLVCGNGGSAADAQHITGEFLCRFYKDRIPLPAIALTTDTSILTSIGNDYSFDDIFKRQVEGLGKKNDILLGISTSGASKNILKAFQAAKLKGIFTILLTGSIKKEIALISDLVITTPSTDTPRIQEMHLLIEHIICEKVEEAFSR